MRIVLGGITHEANSFCARATDIADFDLLRGHEILKDLRSTRTEQAGAISVLSRRRDNQVVLALLARALSGGPIREAAFRALLNQLLERIRAARYIHGVLLILHGAMMSAEEPVSLIPEGELVRVIRSRMALSVKISNSSTAWKVTLVTRRVEWLRARKTQNPSPPEILRSVKDLLNDSELA